MVKIILFLISGVAHSQIKTAIQITDKASMVSEKCSAQYSSQITHNFVLRNHIELKEAVFYELSKQPEADINSSESLDKFCSSMIGKTYGRARFTSLPAGAKIYVGGDVQPGVTNATFAFDPGEYDYRIEIDQNKTCDGKVKIKKNKMTKVPRCKG